MVQDGTKDPELTSSHEPAPKSITTKGIIPSERYLRVEIRASTTKGKRKALRWLRDAEIQAQV